MENLYFVEWLVRERLQEAERLAATRGWSEIARPPRRPLRVAVGRAMICAGQWILGQASPCAGEAGALRR